MDTPTRCACCDGRGVVELPHVDDTETYPCPVCHPWPQGFPGETAYGRWVIEPAAPGEPAVYHPMSCGPLVAR